MQSTRPQENGGESCRFSLDLRPRHGRSSPTGVRTCDLHKRWEGSMKFGTIGAGAVALAFGREALARGHEVVLSSRRGPDALVDKVAELGRGASAASVEEAACLDYVLLAVPWRNVESALKSLPAWNGRVLIDATNPFVETSPKLVLANLGGKGASEVVAALTPGARIVKAFNSIVTARFNEGPVKNGGRRVIFVSGDHPEPTAFIKQLIESFGFTAIDLGDLATGGRLQQAGGPLAGRDLVDFGHHYYGSPRMRALQI